MFYLEVFHYIYIIGIILLCKTLFINKINLNTIFTLDSLRFMTKVPWMAIRLFWDILQVWTFAL